MCEEAEIPVTWIQVLSSLVNETLHILGYQEEEYSDTRLTSDPANEFFG
jgi:hypothetical protein